MKLRIDIPNQFAVKQYADHVKTVELYTKVMQAALRIGMDMEISRARLMGQRLNVEEEEIRYAFHTEQVGENVYCLKSSALPRYWFFDETGYSGWANIANDETLQVAGESFDLEIARSFIQEFRNHNAAKNISKIKQSEDPLEEEIANSSDYIFYPMQVDNDRVLAHLPWEQSDVLRRLIELSERFNRRVAIKRHPLCASDAISEWLKIAAQSSKITITEGSIHDLIQGCACVLVANSGVGLEALLHGKAVCTMAASEYRHMTYPITSLESLEDLFTQEPEPQTERIERLLGYLFLEYLVDSGDDAAIEARIRRHIAAHSREREVVKTLDKLRTETAKSVLLDQTKAALASQAELLLMPIATTPQSTMFRRTEFLARLAVLNVKRKLILQRADPDVWVAASEQLLRQKKYEPARQFAEAACGDERYEGRGRSLLGQIALKTGREEQGIAELRRAIKCLDSTPQAFLILAQRLFRRGPEQYEEAEALAQRALAANPELFGGYLFFARLEYAKDNAAAAATYLEKARALAPDHSALTKFAEELKAT